jgi:hypothetical protein
MQTLEQRVSDRRPGGRKSAPARTLYVFRCSESGLYALATDPEGRKLPWRLYPRIRWSLARCVILRRDESLSNTAIVNVALAAIAEHGFHLAHTAVHAQLLAVTAQHDAEVRMI